MKKLLFFLLLATSCYAQRFDDYPAVTTTATTDLFLVSQGVSPLRTTRKLTWAKFRLDLDTAYVRKFTKQSLSNKFSFHDSVSFRGNNYYYNTLYFMTGSYLNNAWLKGNVRLGQWSEETVASNILDVTGLNNIQIVPPTAISIDSLHGGVDNQAIVIHNNTTDNTKYILLSIGNMVGHSLDAILYANQSVSYRYSSGLGKWVCTSLNNTKNKVDTLNVNEKFIINSNGNIKEWGNKIVEDIPITDSAKVLYSNGKWKVVTGAQADTTLNYNWTGLHTWTQDSLRINTLWYDFPNSRVANSVLYDSLGNGILKWKVYPTGSTIDTTKISYLAKNETFTGVKTLTNGLAFSGLSSYFVLPTQLPLTLAGELAYVSGTIQYFNGSTNKTLPSGTGTTNELTYWSSASTLGTLPTASYPSLTEISYVKGVTSAIQTQLGNTVLLTGNQSISGLKTFSALASSSGIALGVRRVNKTEGDLWYNSDGDKLKYMTAADSVIVATTADIPSLSGYATLAGTNTWTGTNTYNVGILFGGVGYLSLPNKPQTTTGYLWYRDSRVRYFNGSSALALVDSSDLLLYGLKGSANTWTANNQYNAGLLFGATGYLSLPTTPQTTATYLWYRDSRVRYYNGSSARALVDSTDLAGYVALSGNQTVAGEKTFTGATTFENQITKVGKGSTTNGEIYFYNGSTAAYSRLSAPNTTNNRGVTFPDLAGTLALTDATQTFSGTLTYTGVNEFQSDLKLTDDFINVWESATVSGDTLLVGGKTSVTLGTSDNFSYISAGVDGKEILVMIINNSEVTADETGNIANLPSNSLTFTNYGNARFKYYASASKWICIGVDNN